MAKPTHPDQLDALSSSQDSTSRLATEQHPATPDEVRRVVKQAAVAGAIRLPKKARPRNVLLAVICSIMDRYHAYPEAELNELLKALLGSSASLDHTTCRRYLVDVGLVKRDRAGRRYIADYSRVESLLNPAALALAKQITAGPDWSPPPPTSSASKHD